MRKTKKGVMETGLHITRNHDEARRTPVSGFDGLHRGDYWWSLPFAGAVQDLLQA